jgi:hypothetical protein
MSYEEERGPWYLVTALIIGVAFGLFFAWVVSPIQYIDLTPKALSEEAKDNYRLLVSAAFSANGDLERARARLNELDEEDPAQMLTWQAQRALTEGRPVQESHALGVLALAIVQGYAPDSPSPTATDPPLVTPSFTAEFTSTLTPTPIPASPSPIAISQNPSVTPSPSPTNRSIVPTITPLPSRTPTITPGLPFVLKQDITLVCDPNLQESLIIVEALDASSKPAPGVQVVVSWSDGDDRFYTGLKTELGQGYADYRMTPGLTYTVQLAEGGQPVTGLVASECEAPSSERYWGSWHMIFIQP